MPPATILASLGAPSETAGESSVWLKCSEVTCGPVLSLLDDGPGAEGDEQRLGAGGGKKDRLTPHQDTGDFRLTPGHAEAQLSSPASWVLDPVPPLACVATAGISVESFHSVREGGQDGPVKLHASVGTLARSAMTCGLSSMAAVPWYQG